MCVYIGEYLLLSLRERDALTDENYGEVDDHAMCLYP